jgi:DNA-binding MarR family transcriptional regulator
MPTRIPDNTQPHLRPASAEPFGPARVARTNSAGDHADTAAPHERLLFGAARQSGVGDLDSCRTIMAILTASRAIRRQMDREFGTEELTESRFATLITLYAMAPLSATPTDLAYHAEVSRAAMTDVVDALDKHGWIVRERRGDRRLKPVRISAQGRNVAVRCIGFSSWPASSRATSASRTGGPWSTSARKLKRAPPAPIPPREPDPGPARANLTPYIVAHPSRRSSRASRRRRPPPLPRKSLSASPNSFP